MTAVSRRSDRSLSHRLAHMDLVLAPGRGTGARLRGAACAVAALGAVAAAGYWAGLQGVGAAALPVAAATAVAERLDDGLAPRLEQARVALQVAESRGHELERQIDALNQRLHQCQEELMFFRKAGKRTD